MNNCVQWPRAMGLSCMLHISIIIMAGWFYGHMNIPHPVERLVTIDVAPTVVPKVEDKEYQQEQQMQAPAANAVYNQSVSLSKQASSQPHQAVNVTGMTVATGQENNDAIMVATLVKNNGLGEIGGATASLGSINATSQGRESAGIASSEATGTHVDFQSAIERFVAAIEQHKEYPYIARKRQQEGTVLLSVSLSLGGELEQVSILSSSGISRLDDAAVEAVRAACPFPHGTGQELRMRIPITYQLKE